MTRVNIPSTRHCRDCCRIVIKDSANITGLPAGEYSVRVYDNSPATDSTSAAYQHSQLVHIMELDQPSPTLSISTVVSSTMYCSIISALFIPFLETLIFIAESFLMHTTVHNSATPFPMPAPTCMYNISYVTCDLLLHIIRRHGSASLCRVERENKMAANLKRANGCKLVRNITTSDALS